MLRIATMLASYFIGRALNNSSRSGASAPFLMRWPLLMIRKILKLFLIGFGSLLVGLIGFGFFVGDILLQLQTENQFYFKASTGVSLAVVFIGIGACVWTFRKKNWIDPQPQMMPPIMNQDVAPQPDFATLFNAIVDSFVKDKPGRQTSSAV